MKPRQMSPKKLIYNSFRVPNVEPSKPTYRQRRRLGAGIRGQIRRLQQWTGRVNGAVFEAGMELFASEAALGQWLSEPARGLGDKIPLAVMRTAAGRAQVAEVLRAIAQGNFL